MRKLANDGQLHNGSAHTAKQELTVATQLLAFLAARGRSPATCRQADIDAWLASGPTTRSSARTFVRWGHPQPAYPQGGLSLPNGADPPDPRPAGTTRAARRRPLTRIVRLTADRVSLEDAGVWITFDQDPVAVPEPFAGLVRRYVDARPNMQRELVLEMPPAIVARAFGYSPRVTEDHAADAGRTWVTYASYRSLSRDPDADQTTRE
jgi:hypothetical protein